VAESLGLFASQAAFRTRREAQGRAFLGQGPRQGSAGGSDAASAGQREPGGNVYQSLTHPDATTASTPAPREGFFAGRGMDGLTAAARERPDLQIKGS
jgi:hypothetical protein